MRARLWMAGAVLALGGGAALAQSSVWETVWRTETATARTSVVGKARTMTLAGQRAANARVQAARGKLRLDYEAGRRRWSLIDNGRQLIHLDPQAQAAIVHSRPTLAVDRELAARNYVPRVVGERVIAGRPTQLIEIAPRRKGPAVLRLWVDKETGFALKRERYNVEGRLTTGTEYVEVEFGAPVPGEVFLVPEGWKRAGRDGSGPRLAVRELGMEMGFVVREPDYVPSGYVLIGGYVQEWGRWGMRMAELRYTDGLRVLSVFERRKGEGRGRRGGRRGRGRGRGHGRGREGGPGGGGGFGFGPPGREDMTLVDRGTEKALRYFGRELVVVTVGDMTAEELVRVARSVE